MRGPHPVDAGAGAELSLVCCDDERCRSGYQHFDVLAGAGMRVLVNGCRAETYAVVDLSSQLALGCLDEPSDELGQPGVPPARRMSRRHTCSGAGPGPSTGRPQGRLTPPGVAVRRPARRGQPVATLLP